MIKLEIGSGNRPLEGYEHLDINPWCPHVEYVAPMDNIPTEDGRFDEIQAIHVIEHQPWKTTLNTLTEWVRVLKPGGMLRIATPNLRWIAKAYHSANLGDPRAVLNDVQVMNKAEREAISIDNKIDYSLWANFKIMSSGGKWDQHFACFDERLLASLLKKAGCSRTEIEHDGDSLVLRAYK